jgi:UDP-N-acetylglucosamine/UDP-N-acetylgalactosamine diphosphorylase
MNPPPDLVATLARAGQQHLLAFWNRLDEPAQRAFAAQLATVDWPLVAQMQRLTASDGHSRKPPVDLSAAITPPCLRLGDASNRIPPADAIRRGSEALGAGQIGAILVAGGQGTRLGCHGPKGLCTIGPVSKANLFEVLFGKLVAVRRRYGRDVPLAIMTSSATDTETRSFLADHACCGLAPDRVFVFRQHDLPALDAATGTLLLDGLDHLALAPDGHGGMLVALAEAGGLDWFGSQGVEHIVSFQVDNPLAMPLAAEFLGYHLLSSADFSTQVVRKQAPSERVGVVVDCDGRHSVVEYSDLPADRAAERLPDGRLRFHAGSIAVHAFAKAFLDRVAARRDSLPLHLASKVVPFLDASGSRVVPTSPNAIKFERFIFDLMPLAGRVCVVEIEASEGFAPLKNPIGAASDTAEHVHAALVSHARRLLAKAGVTVADGVDVELATNRIIDETDIADLLVSGTLLEKPVVVGG